MTWYKFINSFRGNGKEDKTKLYCDNPQCGNIIEDEQMSYDVIDREIYHEGGCARLVLADKVSNSSSEKKVFRNFSYISRMRALKLLRTGMLTQSSRLEEKTAD